eukprot:2960913-Prymnesium_polylepis.1
MVPLVSLYVCTISAVHSSAVVGSALVRPAAPRRCAAIVALLESYRIESPCRAAAAAALAGDDVEAAALAASESGALHHWVAVYPSSIETSLVEVGQPAAVGRLSSFGEGAVVIDQLRSSIPKEKPAAAQVLGLAIDALLLAWCAHVDSSDAAFEELTASTTMFTAPMLSSRGFAELEKPDLSALGRGEPIATHRARLPAACLAYNFRLSNPNGLSVADLAATQSLLDALRSQPPPPGAADEMAADAEGGGGSDEDPWAAMRRRAGY